MERGREKFSRYKKVIMTLSSFYRLFPLKLRKILLDRHRNTRGKIGMAFRYALVKSIAEECGDNVAIYTGVYFFNPENMKLGNNISFHPMCYIEAGKTKEDGLQIDNDVSIAHGVTIMSTTHQYEQHDVPIKDLPTITKTIHICENVWIGAKATILCGVTIEKGCVIGANAVVTKNTNSETIYAGVPARVIRER